MKNQATFDKFEALDIRVGTVVQAEEFSEARNPAYRLAIDFGDLGVKNSSAQITDLYEPEDLINTQIVAVTNFEIKRVAGFKSEVLVLGIYSDEGVVLLRPDGLVQNGSRAG